MIGNHVHKVWGWGIVAKWLFIITAFLLKFKSKCLETAILHLFSFFLSSTDYLNVIIA